MTLSVRLTTDNDLPALISRYNQFVHGSKAKSWFKYIDEEKVLELLCNSSFIINETYLVVMSEIQPWYFKEHKVLEEQLIVKLYNNGGKFTDVLEFLKIEAKARGCVAVFAGSMLATQFQSLGRLYKSQGYKEEGGQYILEL